MQSHIQGEFMLALHVAISPIYLLLILGLVVRFCQMRTAMRLYLVLIVPTGFAMLIVLGQRFESTTAGLVIALVIGSMLILSMFLLYPFLVRIAPSIMGLSSSLDRRTGKPFISIDEDIKKLENPHSHNEHRFLILFACLSIISLLFGFFISENINTPELSDLVTCVGGGFVGGLLVNRFVSAYAMFARKSYLNWHDAKSLAMGLSTGLLVGWLGANLLYRQNIFTSIIFCLIISVAVVVGVFAWQIMIEGNKHINH